MNLRVERFAGRPEEWDDFVRGSPDWTHFHLVGWRSVIESVLGHECIYLAARDAESRLTGVLPLVRVKSVLFGHYLVSVPFLNYGGPLGTGDAVEQLVAHAVGLAREGHVDLLELRSRQPLQVDLSVSHRKITVLLDLPSDPDRLWRALPSNVRRKVRRPQKDALAMRFGLDQVAAFFEVFSRHMRDLGTPTLPLHLFERLAETFPHDIRFGCAYHGARPVAGACGFRWGTEFEMTWVSALRAYHRIYANMFLYWAFMERAVAEGVRVFNFGRCTPGSGTHQFKLQWGSRDQPLWWYGHSGGRRSATPSPDERGFAWGPALWKHLPVPLATAIGPRIVRYIP